MSWLESVGRSIPGFSDCGDTGGSGLCSSARSTSAACSSVGGEGLAVTCAICGGGISVPSCSTACEFAIALRLES